MYGQCKPELIRKFSLPKARTTFGNKITNPEVKKKFEAIIDFLEINYDPYINFSQ